MARILEVLVIGLTNRIERKMFYNASAGIFEKARMLRSNLTEAEKILWQYLRRKGLKGLRFKAQHPIMGFIADFYCHKAKLIIEIDGQSHQRTEKKEYDQGRTYEMEQYGIRVIRFTNEEITHGIEFVLDEINKYV